MVKNVELKGGGEGGVAAARCAGRRGCQWPTWISLSARAALSYSAAGGTKERAGEENTETKRK